MITIAQTLERRPASTPCCPQHGVPLSGGPVQWHCPTGRPGHTVMAADLDRSYRPPRHPQGEPDGTR